MNRTLSRAASAALAALILAAPFLATPVANAEEARAVHGLSLHGDLKYPRDFKAFDYVNPAAPKGGTLRYATLGSFDTLNPFIVKGVSAAGATMIYDTLAIEAQDEPFSMYGLLAETIRVAPDLSYVEFDLRVSARWHDGRPITPEDVIFTFGALKEKGVPLYRHYYANVTKAEKTGERRVRFTFGEAGNRELPLIIGQLPVLPRHYWQGRDFTASTLSPPLGSGPYRIAKVDVGRMISYERVKDYWGKDLPVNRGRFNFGRIEMPYFRDDTVAFEAFKAGQYDLRLENSAKNWATGYDFPAMKAGKVLRTEIALKTPAPYQGFYFNLRRAKFADPRVREALGLAFDFEWANKTLFFGQYARTRSYFDKSELASWGAPGADEIALLTPHRAELPARLFAGEYRPPATNGAGDGLRDNMREAGALLRQAGYRMEAGKLLSPADGKALEIEFFINDDRFERVIAPFVANLGRLGVTASIRIVDDSQYIARTDGFDFDVIIGVTQQSLSPGNEQREYWGSAAAGQRGSRNQMGIKNPVIDALIEKIVFAPDRKALVTATRALDRVLLWNFYSIPLYHSPTYRIAHWNRFGRPAITPAYGLGFLDSWWIDPVKDKALAAAPGRSR